MGHLGTPHPEEAAESPDSFVALLGTSTFTSEAPWAVAFPFEGKSKEEERSSGPDFDDF